MICKFCSKECKNLNSLRQHERLCHKNPDKKLSNFSKRKGVPSWNKGLTSETDIGIKERGELLKLRYANGELVAHRTKHNEETKRRMSENKRQLYLSGWEPICGRCKKYDYVSPIAGSIKVDGTWELKVAKHLDSLGVQWKRNKKRFPYVKPDGTNSTYQPDFYVEDWNSYLEVKGYETDLDKAKWSQFQEPLMVWKKDKIQTLED